MLKHFQSWTWGLNQGGSDVKDRATAVHAVIQFEDLAGNTGPDGNVLTIIYKAGDAILINNKVFNLKIPAPRGIWQFQWI